MVAPLNAHEWSQLLDRQCGVVSRQQCRDHGITDDKIRRELGHGRWQKVHHGSYATFPGRLNHDAAVWAALAAISRPACASHGSAYWLASQRKGSPPTLVHVAVLEGTRVAALDAVRLHYLPDLGDGRVLWTTSPPRTRPETTVLDLTHGARTEVGQIEVITRAVRERITTPDRLREALARRPRMRNRALVVDMLADTAVGAQSPLEIRDLRNDRKHGLIGGERQVRVKRGRQREWLDVVFSGNGLLREIVKELDGRLGHEEREERFRDRRRDNAAEVRGQSHLRYGWEEMVAEPCEIAWEQYLVLRRNGWRSPFRFCGETCAARRAA